MVATMAQVIARLRVVEVLYVVVAQSNNTLWYNTVW